MEPADRSEGPPPSYIHVEQTLALIKPDAIDKINEIEEIILGEGFSILQVRTVISTLFIFCKFLFNSWSLCSLNCTLLFILQFWISYL